MSEQNLKPCPFCNSEGVIFDGGAGRYPPISVGCKKCSFQRWPRCSSKDAIEDWNVRANDTINEALIAALKGTQNEMLVWTKNTECYGNRAAYKRVLGNIEAALKLAKGE